MAQPEGKKPDRGAKPLDLVRVQDMMHRGVGASECIGHLLSGSAPFRVSVEPRGDMTGSWRGQVLFEKRDCLAVIGRIQTNPCRYVPTYLPPQQVTTVTGEVLLSLKAVKNQLAKGASTRENLILAAIRRLVTLADGSVPRTIVIQFGQQCCTYLWASEVDAIQERYLFARKGRPLFLRRP